LYNSLGEVLTQERDLAANATDGLRIDEIFPTAVDFLGGVGVASIGSWSDLAVVAVTKHQESGVFSAEDFLASANYQEGDSFSSCGA